MKSYDNIELVRQQYPNSNYESTVKLGQESQNELKELKVNKKTDQNLKKKDANYQLQYFESDNTRAFKLIDQMHLENLDEILFESQSKFKSFMKEMKEKSIILQQRSEQMAERIVQLQVEEEKDESVESEKSKPDKEYTTSSMVEVPGQVPRLIKRVVKNSDMNLSKIKELLTTQRQIVDSLENSIREIVSKINPRALGEMNVKGKQPLEELFALLLELLYNEPKDKFMWKTFKQTVLQTEDGQADFLYRLANYDMKQVTQAQVDKVCQMKDSAELRVYLEDPKFGELLIDIADWLEYVFNGVPLVKELVEIEELHIDAKHAVEMLERNQRKQAFIDSLKQDRITSYQNQKEFVDFISKTIHSIDENYQKTHDKLKNHISYQADVIGAIIKIERSKYKM